MFLVLVLVLVTNPASVVEKPLLAEVTTSTPPLPPLQVIPPPLPPAPMPENPRYREAIKTAWKCFASRSDGTLASRQQAFKLTYGFRGAIGTPKWFEARAAVLEYVAHRQSLLECIDDALPLTYTQDPGSQTDKVLLQNRLDDVREEYHFQDNYEKVMFLRLIDSDAAEREEKLRR